MPTPPTALSGSRTNVFLQNAEKRYCAKMGIPYSDDNEAQPQSQTGNKNSVNDSLLGKAKWKMLKQMPGSNGQNTWQMMSVLNKGLSPLSKTSEIDDAIFDEIVRGEPDDKTAGWGDVFKVFSGGKINPATFISGAGKNKHWSNLLRETNPVRTNGSKVTDGRGAFNGISNSVFSPLLRAGGGATVGGLFDDPNDTENGVDFLGQHWGTGSLTGAGLALGSPHALKLMSSKAAPKNTISKLLSDPTLRSRLTTDPLARIVGGAGIGSIADSAGTALGYDFGREGYGKRLGMGLGLAGGLRPAAQLLGGRYKTVGNVLDRMGNTGVGKAFTTAQTAHGLQNVGNLGAWSMGTPYATNSLAPMFVPAITQHFIGDRLDPLVEKRKAIDSIINSDDPNTKAMLDGFQNWLNRNYQGVSLMDADGLPSLEALQIGKHYLDQGVGGLSGAGKTLFGDQGHLFNPDNWERLGYADTLLHDIVHGQYQRGKEQMGQIYNQFANQKPSI